MDVVTTRGRAPRSRRCAGEPLRRSVPRMTWPDAMDRFGSDKPDVRFGMELVDLAERVRGHGVPRVPGRRVREGHLRARAGRGVAQRASTGSSTGPRSSARPGSCGCACATSTARSCSSRRWRSSCPTPEQRRGRRRARRRARRPRADRGGSVAHHGHACSAQLRLDLGRPPVSEGGLRLLWVVDFPLFEGVGDDGRPIPAHHPFTQPHPDDLDRLESGAAARVRSQAYDLVLNGWELGSGSVRIHRRDMQAADLLAARHRRPRSSRRASGSCSTRSATARRRTPGSRSASTGSSRSSCGEENIREVIAFPKTQSGADPLTGAPSPIDPLQLRELGLTMRPPELELGRTAPTRRSDAARTDGSECDDLVRRIGCVVNSPPSEQAMATDLFAGRRGPLARRAPLAARLRPRKLDEVVGQAAPARRGQAAAGADRVRPAVVGGAVGPGGHRQDERRPARRRRHEQGVRDALGGERAGVKDVREVVERARDRLGEQGKGTILFLDEVHRFNRTQQDALLPHVEDGLLVLIGATTENPYFSLTGPLLSRSTLFRLDVARAGRPRGAARARARGRDPRPRRGAGRRSTPTRSSISPIRAEGDARHALTCLELAHALAIERAGATTTAAAITLADAEAALGDARRCATAPTSTTTSSARSSRACAAAMPTPRCSGSRA